ncbi:MAG: isochorismate synthase [Sphingobacteriia bacterium]|nr:isochorismate synthase [Sphingobacteriia bacterium]NCC40930.1 isochorismate synthase [Gammaproteobacteria bacterium]
MLAPLQTLEQILARLGETIGTLPLDSSSGLVSLVLEFPQGLTVAPEISGPQFQFSHNHRGEIRAGYGIAWECETSGENRFGLLREAAVSISDRWQQFDPDDTGFSGFAMLGFAATPTSTASTNPLGFPNTLLWLPELALHARRGQAALILSSVLPIKQEVLFARWKRRLEQVIPWLNQPARDPLTAAQLKAGNTEPSHEDWHVLVQSALEQIRQSQLEKVVLFRRVHLAGRRRFDLTRLQAALDYLFPSCQVITIRRRAGSFVAATPERLFTQNRDRIEVDAIAGTVCRAASTDRDLELTRQLRNCQKNLHEHMVVVESITETLSQCCRHIEPRTEPKIMQLNNAQHLWSIIQAELEPGMDVFRLAERLHPTPATNGYPTLQARAWLSNAESIDRGWYTGVAGIIDTDLTGELWVLLRCAHIEDNSAYLYAGAGIVAGSDPADEWLETEHKLSAMATALQYA